MYTNESDIQNAASSLYDGGWRSHDRDWLQEEYSLPDDEVDAIVKYLAEYEAQEVQS